MKFAVGDRFRHKTWYAHFEPALCEVVSVKRDAYKGEPMEIVRVQEIGGDRAATYEQGRVPARGAA